jgi:late competence protein required for DNA uptake (superfamily II DNA/RNA helicase)
MDVVRADTPTSAPSLGMIWKGVRQQMGVGGQVCVAGPREQVWWAEQGRQISDAISTVFNEHLFRCLFCLGQVLRLVDV